MVLEATVVVLDNSEWMRNGDFAPSRMDAQLDAAHMLCTAKRTANIESSIAVMTMAGGAPRVLVTLTGDQGKLQHAVAGVRYPHVGPAGSASEGARCNLSAALQVAQLVLKNRQNTNQHPRVVVFVGVPTAEALGVCSSEGVAELVRVAKSLRKNSVALDIVQLAPSEASAPLNSTIAAVLAAAGGAEQALEATGNIQDALVANASCECHLLVVSPGCSVTEALRTSLVLANEDSSPGSNAMSDFEGDMDPELALALKLSLEEEQSRMQRPAETEGDGETEGADNFASMAVDGEDDEDAMMARAIAMSYETASREHSRDAE